MLIEPTQMLAVVFPRIFSRGAKFRARGFAARLFVFARKKVKHQGRSQDYFRGCGIKDFKNFSRRR